MSTALPTTPPDPEGWRWAWRPVPVPPHHADFGVYVHGDADGLLDRLVAEGAPDAERRLPYFATLWPAGVALARRLLAAPPVARRVVDVGCGCGVVGLAAWRAGLPPPLFLDRAPEAAHGLAWSARRLGLPPPRFVAADLADPARRGPFDLVLVADLLYEAPLVGLVAAFVARELDPGGEAWIADPGRPHAAGLEEAMRAAGLVPRAAPILLVDRPGGVATTLSRYGWPR